MKCFELSRRPTCYDCGTTRNLVAITTDTADPETGYRDEIYLCLSCRRERDKTKI